MYGFVKNERHIVTMDLPKKIKNLEKGNVYEFIFDQYKTPLSKKVSEYLEKEIDMTTIFRFKLKSLELLDVDSTETEDNDVVE